MARAPAVAPLPGDDTAWLFPAPDGARGLRLTQRDAAARGVLHLS